ncbi:hypothetical protein ASPSYDRAFT_91966 [Aspergillus sydowii CBS 593.65]|uniref:Alpha/beta hydrolase fold-3 domain-containing protein n=1 Tax=Aspergillus sydowii CBS 593.65 TaxID=1036612 RepID=A0A1L9TBB3_9EURO|nr:uncharacterized protein ASPSYDRAFT_91966 [Aspergillus sydowii CBS 593.65]OJJ56718.1 hypothetical protein ASPSYDRAFT_91966 [Aspergillus sydowii CBS 593.65]
MSTQKNEATYRYAHYSIPNPDFDKYKDMENPFANSEGLSVPAMCEIMAHMPVTFPYEERDFASVAVGHQTIRARDDAELSLRIYKDKGAGNDAVLFFVAHGGGWILGDHYAEETMKRLVAGKTNSVVVRANYRLAPEYPFPYAVNDSFDALQWCRENAAGLEIDSQRVVVGGSSVGGNIAAALALKDRNEGIGAVFGQVLNFPGTCHPDRFPRDKYEYYSPEQNKDAPTMTTEAVNLFWRRVDPYASPLLAASNKDLAPALIQVAGFDPGRDEVLAYSEALKQADVPVKTKVYPGLPHAFNLFPDLEDTPTFYNTVVNWINYLDKDMAKVTKFDTCC